jgi:hypothetical protein
MSDLARLRPAARPCRPRLVVAALLALLVVPLLATPASAHGASGQEASNWLTTLTSPVRPGAGVTVAVVESGARLELTSTEAPVVVFGYDGEPYLRVGPDGVLTNTRSPAAVRNATLDDPGGVPAGTDPRAEPVWEQTSDEPTARWYDSRARWTAPQPPAPVQQEPDRRQVVREWSVPVTLDGAPVAVAGTLEWVPGPSALPWWLLALAAAGTVTALALLRRGAARALAGVAALCLLVSVVHSAASAAEAAGGPGARAAAFFTGNAPLMAGWLAAAVGAVQLWRGRNTGLYVAAFGGAVIAVIGGLLDAAAFGSSQVPAAGPAWFGRLTTALSLGLGLGLVAAGITADERVAPSPHDGPREDADTAAEAEAGYRPASPSREGAPAGSPTRPGGSSSSAVDPSRWADSSEIRNPSTSSSRLSGG